MRTRVVIPTLLLLVSSFLACSKGSSSGSDSGSPTGGDGDGDEPGDGDIGDGDEPGDGDNSTDKCRDADCDDGSACDASTGDCQIIDCDADGDGFDSEECGGDDCDDNHSNRFPGNEETCTKKNGQLDPETLELDEDCDPKTLGTDDDKDGHYHQECANPQENGELEFGSDCDDGNDLVRPGATEVCDGLDNDCKNGLDFPNEDDDGDGFADCKDLEDSPALFDCDDNDETTHPSAPEICNRIDNDCDGDIDDGADPDPSISESCDDIDYNCNGEERDDLACEVTCSDNASGEEVCSGVAPLCCVREGDFLWTCVETLGDCLPLNPNVIAECDGAEDCGAEQVCCKNDAVPVPTYYCEPLGTCSGAIACQTKEDCPVSMDCTGAVPHGDPVAGWCEPEE